MYLEGDMKAETVLLKKNCMYFEEYKCWKIIFQKEMKYIFVCVPSLRFSKLKILMFPIKILIAISLFNGKQHIAIMVILIDNFAL